MQTRVFVITGVYKVQFDLHSLVY